MNNKPQQLNEKEQAQEQLENARIGYQKAIDLHMQESGEGWARFNAMLTANSILIAVLGSLIGGQSYSTLLVCILAAIGLVLCAVWALLTARSLAWNRYFIIAARELEEQFLNDPLQVVARGSQFWNNQSVEVSISGAPLRVRMPRLGRIARTTGISYMVIILFALVHVMFIVVSLV